ncbi:hypothetical protein K7432_017610 [Basidiobolus ranarum]|uniref:Uncharacterized protein n=1 Tax=Basidiobolus ranarum TaxID=34480 RepID=A0ABR2VK54_9FUNG
MIIRKNGDQDFEKIDKDGIQNILETIIEVAHKRMFNSEPSSAQANIEQAKGTLKETLGKGVRNERLQQTGMAQKEHGKARCDAVKNADLLRTNLSDQLDSEFQTS